jgi:hypothetical protein
MMRRYAALMIREASLKAELDKELTETDIKPNRFQSCASLHVRIGIGAICIVDGLESSTETEPKGTERGEDDEGECVAENPLANSTKDHQHTAREVVPPGACCSATSGATPAHECHAEWM